VDKYCIFWSGLDSHRKLITICRHDCAMKCMIAAQALRGRILKMFNLSEILPVYLVDRLYLSVAVTYQRQILHIAHLVRFWGLTGLGRV